MSAALGGCAAPSPSLPDGFCANAVEATRHAGSRFVPTEPPPDAPEDVVPPVPARHLYTADARAGTLRALDLAAGSSRIAAAFDGPCAYRCPAFDVQGSTLGFVSLDGQALTLVDLASERRRTVLPRAGSSPVTLQALALDLEHDVAHVVWSDGTTRALGRLDLATGEVTAGARVDRVDLSFDPGSGALWHRATAGLAERLERTWPETGASDAVVGSVAFSPIAFAVEPGRGRLYATIRGASDVVRFDADGRRPQPVVPLPTFGAACPLPVFPSLVVDPATGDLYVAEALCHTPPAVFRLRAGQPPERLAGVPADGVLVLDALPGALAHAPTPPARPRTEALAFTPCPEHPEAECATLDVPIDRAAGLFSLRVVRVRALDPDRVGTLVVDLGGPGLSSTDGLLATLPDDLLAGSGGALRRRFDLVALERRGAAHSTPALACPFGDPPPLPSRPTASAVADYLRWATEAGAACRRDPVAAHLGSLDVAADLEALRLALGEEELSFLGLSYGTTVGALYATRFPARVRAFVLASPTGPAEDQVTRVLARTEAEEAGVHAFLAWCAAAGPAICAFAAPGDDAAAVEARFETLPGSRAALLRALRRQDVFPVSRWRATGLLLAQHLCGEPNALPRLLDASTLLAKPADPVTSVFFAVHALDRPFPEGFDATVFAELAVALHESYPYVGDDVLLGMAPLLGWPSGAPLPIGPTTAPPLLVVTARADFATPRQDALRLVEALGNGSHLLESEGVGHAVTSSDECIGAVVTSFLLEPSRSPARRTCPAIPAERWRP